MRMNDWPDGLRVYGELKFRGNCPNEELEQVTFFNRIRARFPDSYGAVALHPRNEGLKQRGQFSTVSKHRAEGMTAGAADIIIPGSPAFVCELKRRDITKSKWQDGQKEYLAASMGLGAFACLAFGVDAAWEALEEWVIATSQR